MKKMMAPMIVIRLMSMIKMEVKEATEPNVPSEQIELLAEII